MFPDSKTLTATYNECYKKKKSQWFSVIPLPQSYDNEINKQKTSNYFARIKKIGKYKSIEWPHGRRIKTKLTKA